MIEKILARARVEKVPHARDAARVEWSPPVVALMAACVGIQVALITH